MQTDFFFKLKEHDTQFICASETKSSELEAVTSNHFLIKCFLEAGVEITIYSPVVVSPGGRSGGAGEQASFL